MLVVVQVKGVVLQRPFKRLKYADALNQYGSDKPDLRYGLCLYDMTEAVRGTIFRCRLPQPPFALPLHQLRCGIMAHRQRSGLHERRNRPAVLDQQASLVSHLVVTLRVTCLGILP